MLNATRSLDALVREVLVYSDEPDPHEVAKIVFARLDPTECAELLRELLPSRVREVIRFERAKLSTPGTPRASLRRVKVADALAEVAAEVLRSRLCVGKVWMLVGAMTADDHEVVALARRDIAAANLAVSDRHERVAKVMRDVGAETTADLSPDVLVGLFK